MHWDDLRYVLAVHRAGTLAGAARTLKISHVTVFRRIEAIEKDLGARLFDRKQHGYVPTALAEEFLRQAEQVEEQILAMERGILRQDSQIHGTVRIAATDTIGCTVLPVVLQQLKAAHPQIRVLVDQVVVICARHRRVYPNPRYIPNSWPADAMAPDGL